MNIKEFNDIVECLVKIIVKDRQSKGEIRTYKDIQRLYSGNVVGGKLLVSRALQNLKHSYSVLEIPLSREILLKFKFATEYAETELKEHSIYHCGFGIPVYTMPLVIL